MALTHAEEVAYFERKGVPREDAEQMVWFNNEIERYKSYGRPDPVPDSVKQAAKELSKKYEHLFGA